MVIVAHKLFSLDQQLHLVAVGANRYGNLQSDVLVAQVATAV